MPTRDVLDETESHSHFVQLYEADERVLSMNVGKYMDDGLRQGSGVLVVATDPHRDSFYAELERRGWEPERLEQEGRLQCLNSNETLARFIVNGYPDGDRFERAVGEPLRDAIACAGESGLRAYGDMVGVLWAQRQFPAAIRLEQLWNKLRKETPFSLLCAYPVDVFDRQFDFGILEALLCAHTHLLPAGMNGDLETAVNRAMSEVLGSNHDGEQLTTGRHRSVWPAIPKPEAAILWLRNNAPERADEVLALARRYYNAAGLQVS